MLRAALDPEKVFVIPNAVGSEQFKPDPFAAVREIGENCNEIGNHFID